MAQQEHHIIVELRRHYASNASNASNASFDTIINKPGFITELNEYVKDKPHNNIYYNKLYEYANIKANTRVL